MKFHAFTPLLALLAQSFCHSQETESQGEMNKTSLRGGSRLLDKKYGDNISVPNNNMKLSSNLSNDGGDSQPFQWTPALSNDDKYTGKRSGFSITLMNMGSGGRRYANIFRRAAQKWEKIIIGDLPNEPKRRNSSHSWFGDVWEQKVNVDIDDVLIGWAMEDIDGPGDTLGYAGPVYSRGDDRTYETAISGVMKFDIADFSEMNDNDIELVILHEMGHVLGIGTFWHVLCGSQCENGRTDYTCKGAQKEYQALGFQDTLQLEKTICGHWAESNFDGNGRDELMTPYFDESAKQPLSKITCASLEDLGYDVNYRACDPWPRTRKIGGFLQVQDKQDEEEENESIDEELMMPTRSFVVDETRVIRPQILQL